MSPLRALRLALRSLARTPGFTALAIGVLGAGVAVVLVMYGVVATIWSVPPLPDADRLATVRVTDVARGEQDENFPVRTLSTWRREQTSFEDLAGYYGGTAILSGEGPAERLDGGFVTGPFFELLRQGPLVGRTLTEEDSRPGAAPVVVLGERLWRTRYAAAQDVVGRAIRVNGVSATIVGVVPASFDVPVSSELWVADRTPPDTDDASIPDLAGIGRLRPGVSLEAAQADLAAIQKRAAERDPRLAALQPDVRSMGLLVLGREDSTLFDALFASVLLVLLLATVNVAGLLLVRAAGRTHEAAVRRAMGASRPRLVAEMLAESAVIGAASTLLGLTLAAAGLEVFSRVAPTLVDGLPSWWRFGVDARMAGLAVAMTTGAALLAGLFPALRASGVAIDPVLREGVRDTGVSTGRVIRWLVVAEIALSCALLTTAGIMIRMAIGASRGDVGVETAGFLGARVGLPEATYPDERKTAFAERLDARLAALPGVEAAALVTAPPGLGAPRYPYALRDRTYATSADYPVAAGIHVSPGFFDAFRIQLHAGRTFTAQDRQGALPVAVVSESFALAAWPGESAVGKEIRVEPDTAGSPWLTVVGVVGDVQHLRRLGFAGASNVYLPFAQRPVRFFNAILRTRGEPVSLAGPVREEARALDPDLALYWVWSLDESRRRASGGLAMISGTFAVFALVTVLLAASGIYGVLAHSVAQGSREIAIRRAMGAPGSRIVGAVVRRSAWQLALGLCAGLALSPVMGAVLGSALQERVHHPVVYGAVVATLSLAIALATAVPLRRALKLDPALALRHT